MTLTETAKGIATIGFHEITQVFSFILYSLFPSLLFASYNPQTNSNKFLNIGNGRDSNLGFHCLQLCNYPDVTLSSTLVSIIIHMLFPNLKFSSSHFLEIWSCISTFLFSIFISLSQNIWKQIFKTLKYLKLFLPLYWTNQNY